MEVEPLFKQLMIEGGFDSMTAPLTPGSLRIALWKLLQDLLEEMAIAHGARFVPVPTGAFAEDGYLRDELAEHDASHANEHYWALMLRAIGDAVV